MLEDNNKYFQVVRALTDRANALKEAIKPIDIEKQCAIYNYYYKNLTDTESALFELTGTKAPELKALISK